MKRNPITLEKLSAINEWWNNRVEIKDVSFKVISEELLPEYLFMFMRRPDFDRYARFNSWGSARETFALEDLGRYEIPVPSVDVQQDIVNIFNSYNTRRQLVDKLADLQKKICPILIKGATEEGGR